MSDKYSTLIRWSDEDNCYIAIVPELPGCSAFGDTIESAARELEIAKQLTLDVYRDDGLPLPAPVIIPMPHYSPSQNLPIYETSAPGNPQNTKCKLQDNSADPSLS